jgi:hypothetical protein
MRKYSDKFLNQSSKLKDARVGFEFEFYVKDLSFYKTLELINMGVIGGNYENILLFLNKFCETRIKLGNTDFNSDMWTGQYVFRDLLSDKKMLIGEPFTSNFKKYETHREDVYFIHK